LSSFVLAVVVVVVVVGSSSAALESRWGEKEANYRWK
jgi:hypothetical protein